MAGRPEFSQAVNVVSQNSMKLTQIGATSNAVIPAGGSHALLLFSAASTVAEIQALSVSWPAIAAATANLKTIDLSLQGSGNVNVCSVKGNYNSNLYIAYGVPSGHTSCTPDISLYPAVWRGVAFDDTTAFRVNFVNLTDGDTAAGENRSAWVVAKVTAVA